ncbi:SDR family oxidoreductase [Candidatus Bathyarchaeota archaeon]|nr:SDR family oxidoreductase [Candidatus Bathyarchaeota archaeon]
MLLFIFCLVGVDGLRVLVTGGAGFISSHLVDRLLAEGFDVIVLDNLRSGSIENIGQHVGERGFHFVRGDVRDDRLVNGLVRGVNYVFHLAALVSVPESLRDPVLTYDINVNGTLNLLKACVDEGVERFVYASSCAVYGNIEETPIKEGCPTRPMSPYGVSKLTAENYVRKYFEDFGLETVCLRYFNVYGPRQAYNDYSGVITKFINRVKKDLPLMVFGDGEQTRDFVYVKDVVDANMLALKSGEAIGEVFNIGTGVATSINQLAKTLLDIADKKNLKILHYRPREGDIRHSVADISKAKEKMGYNPKITLRDGLKKLLIEG